MQITSEYMSPFFKNWMAYTEASLYNFTLMESLVFANNTTQQENLAFCQVRWKAEG